MHVLLVVQARKQPALPDGSAAPELPGVLHGGGRPA